MLDLPTIQAFNYFLTGIRVIGGYGPFSDVTHETGIITNVQREVCDDSVQYIFTINEMEFTGPEITPAPDSRE